MSKKKPQFGLAVSAALLVVSGLIQMSFTSDGVRLGYMADSHGKTPSAAAVAHAAGEFRIVAANVIWMKIIDHYHHQYLAQGGDWSHNESLIPYLRMITWLDPHFIEAYDVASSICLHSNQDAQGAKFLQDGLGQNPRNPQLNYDMAMYYAWFHRNYKAALPWAVKARDYEDDSFERNKLRIFCHTLQTSTPMVSSAYPQAQRGAANYG